MTTTAEEVRTFAESWAGKMFGIIGRTGLPTTPQDLGWLLKRMLQELELAGDADTETLKGQLLALREEYVTRLRHRALDLPVGDEESGWTPAEFAQWLREGEPVYQPPTMVRMIARRYPWIEAICYLPPVERASFVRHEFQEEVRQAFNVPPAIWQVLREEGARAA